MNEAAERLREGIDHANFHPSWREGWHRDLTEALAAERRATVERIRAAVDALDMWASAMGYTEPGVDDTLLEVLAILDAEDAR